MRSKSIPDLALLLAGAVGLAGCAGAGESSSSAGTASAAAASADLQGIDPSALFSDRDREIGYDEESAAHITLTGTGAETDSDAVSVEGSTVTITDEGVYILTGSLPTARPSMPPRRIKYSLPPPPVRPMPWKTGAAMPRWTTTTSTG